MSSLVKHRTTKKIKVADSKRARNISSNDSTVVLIKTTVVDEIVRNKILDDIIMSLARTPNQNTVKIRNETDRIAKRHKVGKFVVAGVRANLTRGTYGNQTRLIAARKAQLTKLKNLKSAAVK